MVLELLVDDEPAEDLFIPLPTANKAVAPGTIYDKETWLEQLRELAARRRRQGDRTTPDARSKSADTESENEG